MPSFLGSHRRLGFSWGFASPVSKQNRPGSLAGIVPGTKGRAGNWSRGRGSRALQAARSLPEPMPVRILCTQREVRDCPLVSVTILSFAWL